MSRLYVLILLAVLVVAMLGTLVCVAVDVDASLAGSLGVIGLLWVFRRADGIFAMPLSAEARSLGLLVVFPALWFDFRASVPCVGTAALVGTCASIYSSRLGGWRGRVGAGALLGATGVLVPHVTALSLWWLYRGQRALTIACAVVFALLSATVGLIATHGDRVLPPSFSWGLGAGLGAGLGDQSVWAPLAALVDSDARIWVYALAGAVAVGALVALLAFCRRRALSRPSTLDPKEIALASSAIVLLAPILPAHVFVLFLPAAMIGFESWARSCVRPLRIAGGVSFTLAVACAATGALLFETGVIAESEWLAVTVATPSTPATHWPWFSVAALLVAWPLFHRRSHPENLGRAGAGTLSTGTSARPL